MLAWYDEHRGTRREDAVDDIHLTGMDAAQTTSAKTVMVLSLTPPRAR